MKRKIKIGKIKIGDNYPPLVIPEIGINHDGDYNKAKAMVKAAHDAGARIVKFQCHIIEDEMIPAAKKVIPGNAKISIWEIMEKARLTKQDHINLKKYTESLGMEYLCTPFSRAAADFLYSIKVKAFKIGSGECNNYPLIRHIARFRKPIILSTGMNDSHTIYHAKEILKNYFIPYVLLHCTSMYPTPYNKVRLGAMSKIDGYKGSFGLSDHSIGNYTSFAAIALGAQVIEKHFTLDKNWPGPDNIISIDPAELKDLIIGCNAVYQASGDKKEILREERPTIKFAYSSVVSITDIKKGDKFTKNNIWVKRPGTGKIPASEYEYILGGTALTNIKKDTQLSWEKIKKPRTIKGMLE